MKQSVTKKETGSQTQSKFALVCGIAVHFMIVYTRFNVYATGSTIEQTRNENQIVVSTAMASTILAFLSSSIVVAFLIGCACGHFLSPRCKRQPQIREDVQQPATNRQDLEEILEMRENMAYGPLHSTRAST